VTYFWRAPSNGPRIPARRLTPRSQWRRPVPTGGRAAAIGRKADAIVTTSPIPAAGRDRQGGPGGAYPDHQFQHAGSEGEFQRYVGADLSVVGKRGLSTWSDKGFVKSGDFVWMPVEVPGASYGVEEEKGSPRCSAAEHHLGDHRIHLDQADAISRMSDYLTANRAK